MTRASDRGFTLVEMLLVAVIVLLILAMAVPSYRQWRQTRLGKECCGRLDQIYAEIENYAFRHNAGDLEPWPEEGAEATLSAYLKGFTLPDGCPAGGLYRVGSTLTDSAGNIIVPTCSLETADADGSGAIFRYRGLHIHPRSFINNIRNPSLTFAD